MFDSLSFRVLVRNQKLLPDFQFARVIDVIEGDQFRALVHALPK